MQYMDEKYADFWNGDQNLYRKKPCTVERLHLAVWYFWTFQSNDIYVCLRWLTMNFFFVKNRLTHLDKIIYLDTDIIVPGDLKDLWKVFDDFNSTQISGLSPCLGYNPKRMTYPYYGTVNTVWFILYFMELYLS